VLLRVRPATTRDVDELVRVINAAFVVERFFVDRDRTDAKSVHALLAKGEFLVGEDPTHRIVACVYTERRGDAGYFGLLSVVPECKRRGYGRQLIEVVETQFREAGCHQVDIRVVNLRSELPPIYRRLGYVERGIEPFEDPRALHPCHFILMSKPL
jgi:N-acetylglutamate synthase-like GNAT family acetyltransferase